MTKIINYHLPEFFAGFPLITVGAGMGGMSIS